MRTVVAYAWAPDPGNAVVRDDGSVDWRDTKSTAGDDDPAAVAVGKQLADGGELVGLTIGAGDASWALARGVESAVQVTDAPRLTDEAGTASILAAGVRTISADGAVDVVVIGDSERHPGVVPALAGLLGWPALVAVTSATVTGGVVEAVRTVGDVEETVSITPPLVLGVAAASAESRTPGMKELLAARKRPVRKVTLAEIGAVITSPLVERGTRRPPAAAARVFTGDATAAAAQLVAALRAEGVLS
jgi:electron transfer flavoprotein beta subunit